MGEGFKVKCKKCGYGFSAFLGVGMMFPFVYDENVEKMKSSELGIEAKEFFEKYPKGIIDGEAVVVKCKECGNYDVVNDLTMYMPKEGVIIPEEDGYMLTRFKGSYTKYMDYPHKCKKCGGHSKIYKSFKDEASKGKLKCPKCDGMMRIWSWFDWD